MAGKLQTSQLVQLSSSLQLSAFLALPYDALLLYVYRGKTAVDLAL